jgi:hypothetical protein
MRRSIVFALVASLCVLSSGCRLLPDVFPGYRGCDSLRDCLRSTARVPADWCWGNCAVADQGPPEVRIDGVQRLDGK